MSITVRVPSPLRDHTGGADTVRLDRPGDTVRDALEALFELHPGLHDRLLTESSELRPHVALFVGADRLDHDGGLETSLPDGSDLTIVPAVSGGGDSTRA